MVVVVEANLEIPLVFGCYTIKRDFRVRRGKKRKERITPEPLWGPMFLGRLYWWQAS